MVAGGWTGAVSSPVTYPSGFRIEMASKSCQKQTNKPPATTTTTSFNTNNNAVAAVSDSIVCLLRGFTREDDDGGDSVVCLFVFRCVLLTGYVSLVNIAAVARSRRVAKRQENVYRLSVSLVGRAPIVQFAEKKITKTGASKQHKYVSADLYRKQIAHKMVQHNTVYLLFVIILYTM